MKGLRRILPLVLGASMTLSAFAYANKDVYTEAGEVLIESGVIRELRLNEKLRKQDMTIMLSRLMGEEVLASKFDYNVDFIDVRDEYYKPFIAWAYANGLIKGESKYIFGYNKTLTVQELQNILLRTLGYYVDWQDVPKEARRLGIMKDLSASANEEVTRGLMSKMVVNSLEVSVSGSFQTLATKLNIALPKQIYHVELPEIKKVKRGMNIRLPETVEVIYKDGSKGNEPVKWDDVDIKNLGEKDVIGYVEGFDQKLEFKIEVIPDELEVGAVTMLNYKQILVNFNRILSERKVLDKSNYEVKSRSIEDIELIDGKNSVIITLTTPVARQSDVKLTFKEGLGIREDEKITLSNVMDLEPPEIEEIKLVSPTQFDIVFNEPVAKIGEVLVNNGQYSLGAKKTNEYTVRVDLYDKLKEGSYDLRIYDFEDYAGFKMDERYTNLAYVIDNSDINADVVSAQPDKVVIRFNKQTKEAYGREYFYQMYPSWMPTKVTTKDNQEYELYFGKSSSTANDERYIPEGIFKVFVKEKIDDKYFEDVWGNKLDDNLKIVGNIVIDDSKPEAEDVIVRAENRIELQFNKAIKMPDTDNFEVLNSEGEEVVDFYISLVDDSEGKKFYLNFRQDLKDGNYTVKLKNIEDDTFTGNEIEAITLAFKVDDKTAPAKIMGTYVDTLLGAPEYIFIDFKERMAIKGEGSILNVDNYRLGGEPLPKDTIIELFGGEEKVKMVLPDKTDVTKELTVGSLSDANGNFMSAFATVVTKVSQNSPNVVEIKTLNEREIEFKIDDRITEVSSEDFRIMPEDLPFASISMKYVDDQTIITGKLRSAVKLENGADKPEGIKIVPFKIKSAKGTYMEEKTYTNIKDGMSPTIVEEDKLEVKKDKKEIVLVFDEMLDTTYSNYAGQDLIITHKGKKLTMGIDYDTQIADKKMIITISENLSEGSTVKVSTDDRVDYIMDKSGNKANRFTREYKVVE